MEKVAYSVVVVDTNSWLVNSKGLYVGPVILKTCGHKHRTLSGVMRCYKQLSGLGNWYGLEVRRSDESVLSYNEAVECDALRYGGR